MGHPKRYILYKYLALYTEPKTLDSRRDTVPERPDGNAQ
jgi:hypothetical protein